MYKFFLLLIVLSNMSFSKEMNIWIMPNGANSKGAMEDILKPYEKLTKNKVNISVLDWGIAWNKISKALKNGKNSPNIVQLGTTWIGHFGKLNELSILNGEIYNPKRFYYKFFNLTHLYGEYNFYSIPFFSDTRAFLVNKKYIDSLNINPNIETYEQFVNMLVKIKKANFKLEDGTVVFPYGFPGKQDWNIPHNFAPWVWSNGGSFIKNSNNKWRSALLDKGTIVGINKYINFVFDSLASRQTLKENSAVVSQRFIRGEIAIIYSTIEIVKQLKVDSKKGGLQSSQIGKDGLYIFNVPKGEKGAISFSGGSHLSIPKKFENDKETFKLLNYLTSSKVIKKYNDAIGFFPPDTTLWNEKGIGKDMMKMINIAKTSRSYPQIAEWGAVEGILIQYFSEVWSLVENDYSTKKLYKKTVIYQNKINNLFGVTDSIVLSYNDFNKICENSKINHSKLKIINETAKVGNAKTNNTKVVNFKVVLGIFVSLVFIIILVLFIKRM